MAGHLSLSREQEPEIFNVLDKLRKSIVNVGELVKDFDKFDVGIRREDTHRVMKLSSDYVENPETERAFTVGPFSPRTVQDQHESIAKNIALEVHFEVVNYEIFVKRVFWVA
jgi:hypothetical protein